MGAYRKAQRAHSVLSIAAGLGSAAAVSYAAAASTNGSLQAGFLAKYGLLLWKHTLCINLTCFPPTILVYPHLA